MGKLPSVAMSRDLTPGDLQAPGSPGRVDRTLPDMVFRRPVDVGVEAGLVHLVLQNKSAQERASRTRSGMNGAVDRWTKSTSGVSPWCIGRCIAPAGAYPPPIHRQMCCPAGAETLVRYGFLLAPGLGLEPRTL